MALVNDLRLLCHNPSTFFKPHVAAGRLSAFLSALLSALSAFLSALLSALSALPPGDASSASATLRASAGNEFRSKPGLVIRVTNSAQFSRRLVEPYSDATNEEVFQPMSRNHSQPNFREICPSRSCANSCRTIPSGVGSANKCCSDRK